MNDYPTIALLLRHRPLMVAAATLFAPLVACYAGWRTNHFELMAIGLVAGAIVFIAVRSYLELVALIADMLLPK